MLMSLLALDVRADADSGEPIPLTRSLRVTFKVDGRKTPMRSRVTAWTYGAFWVVRDGSSQEIRLGWEQLKPEVVYETARRIIGRRDAMAYFRLGIEMLVLDDPKLAERAFNYSVRLESRLEELVEQTVERWNNGEDPRSMYMVAKHHLEDQDRAATRDRTEHSDQAPVDRSQAVKGATPWKPLGVEEREEAIKRQRHFVQTAGYGPGDNRRRVYETENFIMATDLDEASMRRWGDQLEVMYDTMLRTLDLPEDTRLYAGKAMVFVFGAREAFINFEMRAMGYDARRAGGVCHYRGEDVILAFFRRGSDAEFQSVLVHESVHGFLYRYRSPAGLPTWASEGLADYIAGYLTPASHEPRDHWNHAKNYAIRGNDPMEIMRQSYRNGTWYTRDSYPVSHMLVRFLLQYKGPEFKLWIDDIKGGANWELAMVNRFGVDAETLAKGFVEEIKSERRYTRAP